MFSIFIVALAIPVFLSLANFTRFIFSKIRKKQVNDPWHQFLLVPLRRWFSLVCYGVAAVVFTVFSFLPYTQNVFDYEEVVTLQDNIELYTRYSEEYAESARKQIEEYQRLQSELARSATVQQLQFYSQQQDEVGNALTDRIQFYQNKIMEEELEINNVRGRIRARERNKWYFWINQRED